MIPRCIKVASPVSVTVFWWTKLIIDPFKT